MEKKLGKLYTSNLVGLKNRPADAEVIIITRAGKQISNFELERDLSPTPSLFETFYHEWRNQQPQVWWPKYEKRFKEELNFEVKKRALRKIYKKLQNGQNVILVCYCNDHRYCHRKLVGEFFVQYGVEVEELNPLKIEQINLLFDEEVR